jgi:hypothetical protein
MVQVYEKPEIDDFVEQEEGYIVVPEQKTTVEKKEELKPQKKSRLFKKHKKAICIDKLKRNLNAQIYTNRFVMR